MSGSAELHPLVQFVFQLGVLIVLTRVGGYWLRRWLRLPGVLGELIVGMLIGPYALGRFAWPGLGHLFGLAAGGEAVSPELHALAPFASIVLLFLSGLETDLSAFLRYSVVGTVVGIGGVVFSSIWAPAAPSGSAWLPAGWIRPRCSSAPSPRPPPSASARASSASAAKWPPPKASPSSPPRSSTTSWASSSWPSSSAWCARRPTAGASSGGTSCSSPQSVRVLDRRNGHRPAPRPPVFRVLKYFKSPEAIAALALGCALLLAGLSEMVGLAMIIGAYIMGLSLSRTDLVQVIQKEIEGLHNVLVPVFFATMGMMVDFGAVHAVLKVGIVYAALAVASKVLGCGLPALFCGFNRHGAVRVGVGMLPRGEVALIVAGIGLTSGAIGQDVFGIAILMTLVTTLLGPMLLAGSFENPASGLRKPGDAAKAESKEIVLSFPSPDMADFMRARIVRAFRQEEFYVYRLAPATPPSPLRKDEMFFTLEGEGDTVVLRVTAQYEALARLVVVEEMLALRSMLHMAQEGVNIESMEHDLVAGLFSDDGEDNP
jgi:Kef-type K+ transport system membrane component KefB